MNGPVMADFKTHITTSTVLGVAYGSAGYFLYDISLPHCIVAGTLCSVAGMFPDLDSDSGVPLRETLSFVSVLIPMLMLRRFYNFGWTPETMVFVSVLLYLGVRFGVGSLFRRFTKHRGMRHSIPAAIIAGMLTYLLALSPEFEIRAFKAWAVVLGFLSHLFLDEVYSIDLYGRRLKSSSGTAMKFFGSEAGPNFLSYAALIGLSYLVLVDRGVVEEFPASRMAEKINRISDQIERTSELISPRR
jgi:membrane-bound metal-dependent hydrolase YbcI (DUF457 family)